MTFTGSSIRVAHDLACVVKCPGVAFRALERAQVDDLVAEQTAVFKLFEGQPLVAGARSPAPSQRAPAVCDKLLQPSHLPPLTISSSWIRVSLPPAAVDPLGYSTPRCRARKKQKK